MEKILVIEDEQDIREQIVKILQYEGFNVISAEHGRAGLERIHRDAPDLIICDVLMPELSGYGVLTEIRANPRTAAIPFIFLTARAAPENIRHGMTLGADDYLTKPFKVSDLLDAVRTRLEKHTRDMKQLDDLRKNLSQTLPHELQTPLTAILGFTEFLLNLDRDMLPELDEILEMQRSINECAQRLHHLIANYLLYAKLQMLDYDAEQRRRWQANNLLTNVKDFVTFLVQEQRAALRRGDDVSIDIENAAVRISESHLQKILKEVVENAVKFSEDGTPITLHGRIEDGRYVLRLSDRGRGMTEDQLANVGAYMQFDRDRYEQQGMGLGLTLARMLAALHGGRLELESAPGQGTTVTLILNIAEERPEASGYEYIYSSPA